MNIKRLGTIISFAAMAIAVQLVTSAMDKEYYLTQLTMAVYYAIVVLGLCLLMGFAGQVSLGHGAFFAIGGYMSAFLTTHDFSRFQGSAWVGTLRQLHVLVVKDDLYGGQIMTVTPTAAFLAAMTATVIAAYLIGYPALRLKGHYLAMATLGFGLIVNKMVLGSSTLGAADGITGVPEWTLFGGLAISGKSALRVSNYYIACLLTLAMLVLMMNLIQSRVGRALRAIHDREAAANAIGIDTSSYKLNTFVLSALLAAIAGVCFTHYTGGIGPSEAGALKSVRYVALAAIGGMANPWGAVVVSTLINFLSLRGWFGSYDNAVFGAALIIIISIAPQGPLKPLGQWVWRVFGRSRAVPGGEHATP